MLRVKYLQHDTKETEKRHYNNATKKVLKVLMNYARDLTSRNKERNHEQLLSGNLILLISELSFGLGYPDSRYRPREAV